MHKHGKKKKKDWNALSEGLYLAAFIGTTLLQKEKKKKNQ